MTHFLHIRMLEGFQLLYGEVPVVVRSTRVQSLLAYLLLHRHKPQPRQQIASHLWPDSSETQARANLRKLLFQLRQILPESHHFIQIEAGRLQWRLDALFTFDVAQFEEAVSQAKRGGLSQQRYFLEQAVELYAGDLLPSCYDDWILPQRERLRQKQHDVLHDLIQLLETQGEYQNAIHHARQLRRIDPLREATYRQLMRLHSLNGDRASAIDTFRQCQQVLNGELAIGPSPATRDLYTQILDKHEPEKPKHNLPEQLTSFVGREEELIRIEKRFQDENCRLLTLIGPGGIGKTRLALQAAFRLVDEFEEGVIFVSLEPVASPSQFVTAVAEALNFSFYRPREMWQQLIDYLGQKQVLLVLDNFEHLLEAGGLLTALLHQAREVRMLITSRERLKLPNEWLLEVEGLPWPEKVRDFDLETYGAVQLFSQRANQVRPSLAWAKAETEAVVRICQKLEGMPLGIELAAAWLRVLSCTEIETELIRNMDVLDDPRSNRPSRHRSLRAVFEQSWHFLSQAEQTLWCKLVIFHGRFDRQAAAQVSGTALSSLMAFVDKSLLRLEGSGWFSIHPLMRQYGWEKLKARPQVMGEVQTTHGDYYLLFLHNRHQALMRKEQQHSLTQIASAIDNIRAAWHWANKTGQNEKVMLAADALERFFQIRGWFEEGREQFGQAVTQVRQQLSSVKNDPEAVSLLSRLLINEGLFHLRLSAFEKAADCLEEAIEIRSKIKNGDRELAMAMIRLGEVRYREGEYNQTQQLCREGLEISQALGETDAAARALSLLAQVAQAQGSYDEAYQFFQQSRDLSQELGDSWSLAHVHNNLGTVAHDQGRYDKGWQHFQKSLTLFRELGDRWGQALVTNNMGFAAMSQQRFDEAEEQLQESLKLRREFGNRWAVAFVLNNLGRLNLLQGRYTEARTYCQESLAIRRQHDDHSGIALCLVNLGDIALGMGETETARAQYLESLEIAMALQNKRLVTFAVLGMAKVLSRQGPDDAAFALELLALITQHPASTTKTVEEAEQLMAGLATHFPPAEIEELKHKERSLSAVATELLAL